MQEPKNKNKNRKNFSLISGRNFVLILFVVGILKKIDNWSYLFIDPFRCRDFEKKI
jgi:hypothetical protein